MEQSIDDYSSVQPTLSSINEDSSVAYHSISSFTGFHSSSNVEDHHLISSVGTNPHSSGVGDYHHSSSVFPLSRYKVRESDNKHETSIQLSVAEDRLSKKTKNTMDKFNDSDNDDEFAQVDIDAAIAASLECSAKHDHDNNDPNVSQRVMSNAQGLDPNAFPSTPPSTPPTTASSTSGNVNALDRSRVRQSP